MKVFVVMHQNQDPIAVFSNKDDAEKYVNTSWNPCLLEIVELVLDQFKN